MSAVFEALAKAFGQLSDTAILRVVAKSILVTLLVFAALGIALYHGLIWVGASQSAAANGWIEAAAAVLLVALAGWFLFRVVALAVLQFFADEIVAAVEARHFPEAACRAKPLPFRRDLANSLRGAGRAIGVNLLALPVALVLLITGVGPAILFLLVNAWLLGRELTDMAWLRHCQGDIAGNPVARSDRFILGAIVAAMLMVPFVGFIAPILGAAAGTHLTHRAIAAREGAEHA
ncbi:EI24 domain-containing protein [uncultured Erythrobacter sp.]|uniref:EI24 domain-containing protein n=1 Tax=uncultured Erythrobacter sp. TaxID=263913 RepID=UPI002624538E|nr:EI24 domain-containing protein [uncultured Erythrobacter sp.]